MASIVSPDNQQRHVNVAQRCACVARCSRDERALLTPRQSNRLVKLPPTVVKHDGSDGPEHVWFTSCFPPPGYYCRCCEQSVAQGGLTRPRSQPTQHGPRGSLQPPSCHRATWRASSQLYFVSTGDQSSEVFEGTSTQQNVSKLMDVDVSRDEPLRTGRARNHGLVSSGDWSNAGAKLGRHARRITHRALPRRHRLPRRFQPRSHSRDPRVAACASRAPLRRGRACEEAASTALKAVPPRTGRRWQNARTLARAYHA